MDILPKEGLMCHMTGFKQSCRALVSSGKCGRWMQIAGHNPNTGEPVNRFDCVDNWVPMLLIENSQMQRQTGAAVESFRNEVVRSAEAQQRALNGNAAGTPALPSRRTLSG